MGVSNSCAKRNSLQTNDLRGGPQNLLTINDLQKTINDLQKLLFWEKYPQNPYLGYLGYLGYFGYFSISGKICILSRKIVKYI